MIIAFIVGMHIEKMSAMPLMDAFVEVLIKPRIKTKKKANIKQF